MPKFREERPTLLKVEVISNTDTWGATRLIASFEENDNNVKLQGAIGARAFVMDIVPRELFAQFCREFLELHEENQ